MMTSTFPTSKSDNSIRNKFKEIQTKKETLALLEQALKQRINELKELCLKEGVSISATHHNYLALSLSDLSI